MDKKELTKKVKEMAIQQGVDYVGVAPVDRFKNAPEWHRPWDVLPGAQSVISISMKISYGPQLTQRLALLDRSYRHNSFSYRWYAYGQINMYNLDRTALLLAKYLESEGQIAVPIVASGVEDNKALLALFSNRHAGCAAGLGEIGYNGLCLTPQSGPRQRFCSIITTAKLDPSPMYSGPKLCDVEVCKQLGGGRPICVKLCPAHSFSLKKMVSVDYGERSFEYAWMDHGLCAIMGSGSYGPVLGPIDRPVIPLKRGRVTYQMREDIPRSLPPANAMEPGVYGRSHFCGICLLRCPVGMNKKIDDLMRAKGEKV
jgi:epoxyqueuosine reductase